MKKEHILVWIPINESLPEYDVPVLVTCGNEVELARRDHTDSAGEHFVIQHDKEEFHDVTHWMQVPGLPV